MPISYAGRGASGRAHSGAHGGRGLRREPSRQGVGHRAGGGGFVDACLTNDLGRIEPGQAQYTLCCADDGGVVDDLIAYLREPGRVFLVPNAANTAAVAERCGGGAGRGRGGRTGTRTSRVLAVQGPRSAELLVPRAARGRVMTSRSTPTWRRRDRDPRVPHRLHRRARLRAARPRGRGGPVWDALLAAAAPLGGRPCGLGGPRHAAHRDGLPAARPGPVPRDHPGTGGQRMGRGLEEAGVLGTRGAGGGEGGRAGAAAARAPGHWAVACPGRGWRCSTRGGSRSARRPRGRSPRR